MRSKKGQYFIVAAVILIILVMSIASANLLRPRDRYVFDVMKENFLTESYMAINSASGSGRDIHDTYLDYTNNFRDYAESRNIQFDLIYMLSYNDTLQIVNLMRRDIEAISTHQRADLSHGDVVTFSPEKFIEIYVAGTYYSFEFGEDDVQLKAMFDISSR